MSYIIEYDKKNYLVKLKIFGMNIKDEHLFKSSIVSNPDVFVQIQKH